MAKKKTKLNPATTEGAAQTSDKKKGSLIGNIILLMALGGASFGAVYMLPDRALAVDLSASHLERSEEQSDTIKVPEITYLELEPLAVSLEDDKLLKIGITLEVLAGEDIHIEHYNAKIRDAFTGYLRALRLEQLEDAAYMSQMRAQLLRRSKLIVGAEKVHGILITDFLVR